MCDCPIIPHCVTDDVPCNLTTKDCQCPNVYLNEEWLDDRIGCYNKS